MKRRQFIKITAGAVAAVPNVLPSRVLAQGSPNDRINVGVIGVGGMGIGDMHGVMRQDGTQIVAVCDVASGYGDKGRAGAKAQVEKYYAGKNGSGTFKGCDTYSDFRELCARKDIDAVIVATPDHWHALATLEALRNGKDVYCEKPITHLFAEGQAVYREVAKRNAVLQTGSQQRSDTKFRIAVEIVRNGLLGKIKQVEVGLPRGNSTDKSGRIGQPVPDDIDYDLWCGPSRYLPFHPDRLHWNWRWCLDYGGGQLMDWIGHHHDIAQWGLGLDKSGPNKVEAVGFTFPEKGMYDGPIDYEVRCEYDGGYTSSLSNKHRMGTKWIGENGWVWVDRGNIEASNPEWFQEKFDRGSFKGYVSRSHHANWVECIRSRKECITPAETAHRSATPGHIGYVSLAVGRPLKWDPKAEVVIDDPVADKLLKAVNYRGDWKLT
jgi:predicted dehydrogenase